MSVLLKDLAKLVDGKVAGDSNTLIAGIAGIEEAKEGDITFLAQSKYLDKIKQTKASAIIVSKIIEELKLPAIISENPLYAFSLIISHFHESPYSSKGIDSRAIMGKNVSLGNDLSIYPSVVIGDRVIIGDRVTIYPGVYVGNNSEIGADSIIYPNVTIMRNVYIGKRVIIHGGTVIGGDGYGYVPHNGRHHKIPQVGSITIEDDVEIGSNVSVDRATLGKTIIKSGTKIDNLVQIAHNVKIGENSIIISQAGVAGSSEIGKNVILAGQVGVVDHIKIGDNAQVGAQSGVTRDIEPNEKVFGTPFLKFGKYLRCHSIFTRLPEMKDQLKAHEERLKKIEKLEDEKAEQKDKPE